MSFLGRSEWRGCFRAGSESREGSPRAIAMLIGILSGGEAGGCQSQNGLGQSLGIMADEIITREQKIALDEPHFGSIGHRLVECDPFRSGISIAFEQAFGRPLGVR